MTEDRADQTDRRRRVLIVEDDHVTRFALARLLAGHGYEVWAAADVLRGLKLAREHRPDRVLLDLMLPGQPGEHLLQAIGAVSPATRVAVMTAVADEGRLALLSGLGAERVIRKPIDLPAVLAWLGGD